ncbi:MAG: 3-dehydroquinate synthase, partial [Nitrospirae bacterium]
TFYQPRLVIMDTATLRTLPPREWKAGLAEVIKYGTIADAAFFAYLEKHLDALLQQDADIVRHVVSRCCEIKAEVVARDERESGLRRILNFGHTVGHAIESWSGYRRYLHGEAVAIGMVQEAELAWSMGLCSRDVPIRQRELVRRAGLPDRLPSITFSDLWAAMQHDKKVAQGAVHCVLPRAIGEVTVAPLSRSLVGQWFRMNRTNHPATHRRAIGSTRLATSS